MTEHDRRLMIKNPADTPTPDDLTQSGQNQYSRAADKLDAAGR